MYNKSVERGLDMPVSKNRRKRSKRRREPARRPTIATPADGETVIYQDDKLIITCSDNLLCDKEGDIDDE